MPKPQRKIICWLHVPMEYPDGTAVPNEVLNGFLEDFDRAFGGASVLETVRGYWQGVVEPMMRVEVAVAKDRIPEFRAMIGKIGRATKQKEMYWIENPQAKAHFLPIEDNESGLQADGGGQ